MKSIILLGLLVTTVLTACAGSEEAVSVSPSVTVAQLIPSAATSCLALKQATGGTTPTSDISSAYFRIPQITFTKKDKDSDFFISVINITLNVPGSSTPIVCSTGGDALSALSDLGDVNWWASASGHQSKIPAGTASYTTVCPLYCGGITSTTTFSASATMEVFGLEQAVGSSEQTAVKTTTTFTVQRNY